MDQRSRWRSSSIGTCSQFFFVKFRQYYWGNEIRAKPRTQLLNPPLVQLKKKKKKKKKNCIRVCGESSYQFGLLAVGCWTSSAASCFGFSRTGIADEAPICPSAIESNHRFMDRAMLSIADFAQNILSQDDEKWNRRLKISYKIEVWNCMYVHCMCLTLGSF